MAPLELCEPVLTHARRGWMARTPDDHPYRIAVIERTDEEALAAFEVAMTKWRELHERSEPNPRELKPGEDRHRAGR